MRAKSLLVSAFALSFAATALVACGGDDDDGNNAQPDASVSVPDAATGNPDAPVGGCTSPASITLAPSDNNSVALLVPAAAGSVERYIFTYVTGDVGTQFLQFRHNTPVTIGTPLDLSAGCTQAAAFCYALVGNYQVDANNQVSGDVYFATGGTMTITEAGAVGGNFKANLSGVTLTHFDTNGQPAADGCTTTIADTSVDLVVMAPMKPAQPGTTNSVLGRILSALRK